MKRVLTRDSSTEEAVARQAAVVLASGTARGGGVAAAAAAAAAAARVVAADAALALVLLLLFAPVPAPAPAPAAAAAADAAWLAPPPGAAAATAATSAPPPPPPPRRRRRCNPLLLPSDANRDAAAHAVRGAPGRRASVRALDAPGAASSGGVAAATARGARHDSEVLIAPRLSRIGPRGRCSARACILLAAGLPPPEVGEGPRAARKKQRREKRGRARG